MSHHPPSRMLATFLGLGSIVLWSSTIGISRSAFQQAGTLTVASVTYLLAGSLGLMVAALRPGGLRGLERITPRYLIGCGGCFIVCVVTLYLAVGWAQGGQQVLEVGVINYLWPSLTVALSIPFLGMRGGWGVATGTALAIAGVIVARVQPGEYDPAVLMANLRNNALPYLLALAAAVSWALYSNLNRRWAAEGHGALVPCFFLLAGLLLLAFRLRSGESSQWTPRAMAEVAYMAVFPQLLGYSFWDVAMRHGRMVLVATISFFTPIFSMLVSMLYLGISAGMGLWIGCALVTVGAILCRLTMRQPDGTRET